MCVYMLVLCMFVCSYQGKATEAVKDVKVRAARERGVAVVSPYWLLQCKDKHARLKEENFPITFNPAMAMVCVLCVCVCVCVC